jgi:hypothetical protein
MNKLKLGYTNLSKYNGQEQKELTVENVNNSIGSVVSDTLVNGTMYAVTGKFVSKIIPMNSGWIEPRKFATSFAGSMSRKMQLQTIAQGLLIAGAELGRIVNGLR